MACGIVPLSYYGEGAFLARAGSVADVPRCPVSRYLSWAGAFLTTDRMDPEVLEKADLFERKPYEVSFVRGTTLEMALRELPPEVVVDGSMVWENGTVTLGIQAVRSELETLLTASPSLLSIMATPEVVESSPNGQH